MWLDKAGMLFANFRLITKARLLRQVGVAVLLLFVNVSSALSYTQGGDEAKVGQEKQVPLALINQDRLWQAHIEQGKNRTVYFHAWGGDAQINRYIQWLSSKVKAQYNIDLQHVKLIDTSEAVSRVLAEKSAGNNDRGRIDIVWINGENFASMQQYGLLSRDWVGELPNFSLTNPSKNPAMTRDFGIPTQGMEAPWGQASLTFYYAPPVHDFAQSTPKANRAQHSLSATQAPKTIKQILAWAKQNPGHFTYPKPPDFLSLSFLKYALITLNEHQPASIKNRLYQAQTKESQAQLLPPLWQFLDEIHPYLWRQGRYFVTSGTALQRLVGDGELSLGFTFAAAQVPAAVMRYDLPEHTRSYVMQDGSLSNIHFLAIPYNTSQIHAAKLVVNFMLSVEAQAKKQQAEVWGDSTVIDMSQLTQQQQSLFDTLNQHPSALPINSNITALSEPHPSWTKLLTREWLQRYGVQ